MLPTAAPCAAPPAGAALAGEAEGFPAHPAMAAADQATIPVTVQATVLASGTPELYRRWACPPGSCRRSLEEVPKAKPQQSGLEEVERALSVLEGRHPEHERTRRETLAAAEQRRHQIAAELAVSRRKRLRRTAVIAANLVAVTLAGYVASRLYARTSAIRDALARDEAPFVARGYSQIASNEITARTTLEKDAPESSCFVAIATRGPFRVHAGDVTAQAQRSVGWCDCAGSHVTLETSAGAGADATPGLALLRIDSRAVGGPLARSWLEITPETWIDTPPGCAEAMLDAWIADGRVPRPAPGDGSLDAIAAGKTMHGSGFELVAQLADEHPFVFVDSRAGDCVVAISPGGTLSLRSTGGERVIRDAAQAMAWCSSVALPVTVWRGAGSSAPIVVAAARADRVGGLIGTVESARDAGLTLAPDATWLRPGDGAWDASAILRASRLDSPAADAVPAEPATPDARVTALVFTAASRISWAPPGTAVVCDPPLGASTSSTESVCASAGPVAWWRGGDSPAWAARAALPFWLSVLEGHREPDAIARIPEILGLARWLARRGFEPTVLEGVTELPTGVRIVGRAGEDAVVAVGLAPRAPWVFPYSNADAWELGEPPRVVELEPGTAVTLTSTPPSSVPVDKRRTVVFRHVSHL